MSDPSPLTDKLRPKALVLGGYGMIGHACLRMLDQNGFEVVGVGRSVRSARAVDPDGAWIIQNIASATVSDWRTMLDGVDVVVNASGALQGGGKDDLEAIHVTAVKRLVEAAFGLSCRIIQISAAGVSETASTEFFRSKARGEAELVAKAHDYVILRPTLVLSQEAYGGTALLRAAAAIPLIHPQVFAESLIQTVYVQDVADAVMKAAKGEIPSGTIADLTESNPQSFPDLLTATRRWLGFKPPVLTIAVPEFVLSAIGKVANGLAYLGWRSPLRTTAIRTLKDGVQGDADTWACAGGTPMRPLAETFRAIPATRQERLFARTYLALPLAIAMLSLFWCVSGIIALANPYAAMQVMFVRDAPNWIVAPMVYGGAVADITLGLAILWRRWVKSAALGMILLAGGYIAGSVLFAPDLWTDPLGPMVKVFPSIALAALVWLMVEER